MVYIIKNIIFKQNIPLYLAQTIVKNWQIIYTLSRVAIIMNDNKNT